MNKPTEVELKLLIDPADIPKLRRHHLLKALCRGGPETRKLYSVYFDTEDFFLKKNGIALRVRREGRNWVQTVKGEGRVQAGLHQRDEWEAPVAGGRPDFTKIADPSLAALFSEGLRPRLRPMFTTEFARTAWLLETEESCRVELALDRGEIRAGEARSAISEVELELKAGSPAALYELALELQKSVPLRVENASKAERGYALCALPGDLPAVGAADPGIAREMSVDEAFRAIAWNCIGQLQENQSRLAQGYDLEYVHQMRVAVRRLRSALNLFAAAAPAIKDAALIGELRWLAGQLGPARDWDVFMAETLPPVMEALPGEAGLPWLRRQAVSLRRERREQAREAASSQRYHKLLLTLGGWLWRAPWRTAATAAELDLPVAAFAAQQLARRHCKLCRRGRGLADLTVEQRHAVRIAAKKLRYATGFFFGLYPRKETKRYLKALARLQDGLGALNDRAVTGRLLAEIAGGRDPLRIRAGGVIIGWNACKTRCQLSGMARAWKRFRRGKVFWEEG